MKRKPPDSRNALSALRLSLALTLATLIPLLLYGSAPSWWPYRGVLIEQGVADDYAPANQGQLKNIAKAAVAEMDAKLSGGAGQSLHQLVASWAAPTSQTNDFAPVNLGQLKNVAKPFYLRLIEAGIVDYSPWLAASNPPDDFAIVNVGQVKNLFAFEIPATNSLTDALQNRLAAGERAGNLALEANAIWFWGNRFDPDSNFKSTYPRRLTELSDLRSVSAGTNHLVALANNGTVWTWGKNNSGQLGDGTNVDRNAPAVLPNVANIVSVQAGGGHTLALHQDGTVLAWGDNYYGQLGTGDNTPLPSPVQVVGLTGVRKIAVGPDRSVALKEDGTVWTWGYDHYASQTGQDISNNFPSQVADFGGVIDIAVGYEHVVALKADGTVWAWGSNYSNQIGNGNYWWQFQDVPAQVPNLANVVKIAAGFDHTLAVVSDGTVWAWGVNSFGQLGDGTTQPRQSAVQVTGLTDVIAIAASWPYSLAMKSDGTVWTWGDGSSGTLPNVDLRVPQQVGLGLLDTDHDGMDDRWELEYLGALDGDPNADLDGDGISNLREFLRGTDPRDYFNGATPIIEIVSGNNQVGDPGTFLPKPVTVRIKNAAGQPLVNAPVAFRVTSGSALITTMPGQTLQDDLMVRTNTSGQANAYVLSPPEPGTSARIAASPAIPESSVTATGVSFRETSRLTPPSTPTPSPNPNASPSPTPSPTATPKAPYRYAIIDLGDFYPVRINNKGTVLVYGPDENGPNGSGYARWRAGEIQHLSYSAPPFSSLGVTDMNDQDVVVGFFSRRRAQFGEEEPIEFQGGLHWPATNQIADKFSAPGAFFGWGPYDWDVTFRGALLSAINNSNDVFGQIYTGSVRGFLESTHFVSNSARWPAGSTSAAQLSNATATNDEHDLFLSHWTGSTDYIKRASGEHYIGRKLTWAPNNYLVGEPFPESTSGMIDGQSVFFDPVDINEAGIVVGSAGADMIVSSSPNFHTTIIGASALAINDHTRPPPSPQTSPASSPLPTPIPAPQILGWIGNALALWELQPDGNTWHPFGLEEMIPSMDGWDYLEPSDMNDNGLIIGTAWYTDPSNPQAQGEYHGFLLVPAELMVDGNRDGKIDMNDSRLVTESDPWRWWINDDDDSGDTGGSDIPQNSEHPNFSTVAAPDGNNIGIIDGTRDLVDFFPLYLNISELVRLFPADGSISYTYNLKQEGGAVNFVYTDLAPAGALDYLRKLTGTGANNALALGGTPESSGAVTHRITSEGVALDPEWLKTISSTEGGVLLIEGRKQDNHPIVLEIYDSAGHRITQVQLPLSVSSVEQMYRHKNLMAADNAVGGPPDYATGNDTQHAEPENYPDSLCNNKNFVFVHGYNVNPNDARGWNAEMFKRLHQSGSKARFVGVTWNGADTQITGMDVTVNYHKNVDHAFQTAKGTQGAVGFADYVKALGANVIVAAHSLGNLVVASAISDWELTVDSFFMIDAAISSEVFNNPQAVTPLNENMLHPDWLNYPSKAYATEWHSLFSSDDVRSTLSWTGRFANTNTRIINFYSSGEEVLAEHPNSLGDPSIIDIGYTQRGTYIGKYAWALQEKLKGRIHELQSFPILGSVYGGWGFTHNIGRPPHTPSASEVATLGDPSFQTQPIFDPGFDLIEHSPSPGEPLGYVSVEPHGPAWVVDLVDPTKGSDIAAAHRNTLLAEMFPAKSLAIGLSFQSQLGEGGNFDMQQRFKVGWPYERSDQAWRHSDIREVTYSFIYPLFDTFVQQGALNHD